MTSSTKNRKVAASPASLLGIFTFACLGMVSILPSTAGATVRAYIDSQGMIHYVREKNNETIKRARFVPGKKFLKGGSGLTPNTPKHSQLNQLIQKAALEHGVDPHLIRAVIKTESNFDPLAVSPKGAQGLMQLMPATARELNVSDPLDPQDNINGGAKYLRLLLDSYNWDLELSLAAYNAGPGRVKTLIPNIPETKKYVAKVLASYQNYQMRR